MEGALRGLNTHEKENENEKPDLKVTEFHEKNISLHL